MVLPVWERDKIGNWGKSGCRGRGAVVLSSHSVHTWAHCPIYLPPELVWRTDKELLQELYMISRTIYASVNKEIAESTLQTCYPIQTCILISLATSFMQKVLSRSSREARASLSVPHLQRLQQPKLSSPSTVTQLVLQGEQGLSSKAYLTWGPLQEAQESFPHNCRVLSLGLPV